jgi:hypothetical protein
MVRAPKRLAVAHARQDLEQGQLPPVGA